MNFAYPNMLLWGLLAVPVVVFYILKIRLRRVPVSTVIFWQQVFEEKKPRSIWQRLRHLVSLLVQLALLALLVMALTEPFLSSEVTAARRVVLVIDNSASMNATDVAPTRLAKAKEEARQVVQGLSYRDEMAIVAAGTQPRVVCGLTGHQKTLRDALAGLEGTDGPTQLADAVALARRLAAEKGDGREARVVVVTDGCSDAAAKLSEDDGLRFVTVGGRAGNVGITRFQVRRSAVDPIGYELLIEVSNQSDDPAPDFRVEVRLNETPLEIEPVRLGPNGRWSKVVENRTADGGVLTARLSVKGEKGDEPLADALATDDVAYALLPKRESQPVRMTSPQGNLFLQKVLEANPLVKLTVGKELPADPAGAGTVQVFHRAVPAKIPPGPVLVVDPANDCDLWKLGDKLQNPIVTQQDKDSPLMAHVRLDNVLLPEARKVTYTPAAGKPRVLAASVTGDPLFLAIDRAEGKVVVLTVNLDLGDLPFRTAFPIMVTNTLNDFAGGQGELRESLATGATADVTLPPQAAGATEFLLRGPAGGTKRLPAGGAATTIGPFDACGVWAVVPDAPGAAPVDEFAVNLMNRAESDLRPPDGVRAAGSVGEAGLVSGFFGRPVSFYLVALALLLAAAEWYLYQRRWIS